MEWKKAWLRGLIIGVTLASGVQSAHAEPVWKATASSAQEDLTAQKAIDGNRGTRWGSEFRDGEWLQIDFGQERDLAGLRIFWEAAYGRDYDILLSNDGANWSLVFAMRYGDGNTDELFFGLRRARYLKLFGHRRGTGWGFSIWEMELLGPDELPALSAGSESENGVAANALDGDTSTLWVSAGPGEQHLTLNLKTAKDLGGVEILWGDNYASHYEILISDDGEAWRPAAEVKDGVGGSDLSYFNRASTRWLRLLCREGPGKAYGVREILLKSGDESWSPMRFFESLQSRLPKGALPRWLSREQSFWTVVGVPRDEYESLIGEEGTIEPYNGSFIVSPFIVDGSAVRTYRDFEIEQTLAEGVLPMPTVSWRGHDLKVDIRAVSFGGEGSSITAIEYRVTNGGESSRDVGLALAVRPLQLNPPWQHGGVSNIEKASFDETDRTLTIGDRMALTALSAPSAAWMVGRDNGDVFSTLTKESAQSTKSLTDDKGLISAAQLHNLRLGPGESRSVVVLYPLYPGLGMPKEASDAPDKFFDRTWAEMAVMWRERTGGWDIRISNQRLVDIARTNLAYMMLNADMDAPQPGPRNYAKAWMRDGALSAGTYLRLAKPDVARGYLDWVTPQIGPDGFVPPMLESKSKKIPEWARDWKEYDAQGEYVYAVRQYYEYTRDKEYLRSLFPTVIRVIDFQQSLIDKRKTPQYQEEKLRAYYGILPESNSHEGYFPAMHSYWDDFFALKGWTDAVALAEALGEKEALTRLKQQEKTFREDFYASIRAVIARDKLAYMPGCVEKGDFDPTSTSIALDACDEQSALMDDPVLSKALMSGYDRYMNEARPRWTGGTWQSFTPYEVRNVEALVRLGRRDEALALMAFFTGEPVRPHGWNHMAEVVHTDPRTGSYIGDMPHTWVASDYINSLRSFFVYEDNGALILAAGVPDEWIRSGVTVDLPTWYGRVRYELHATTSGEVTLDILEGATPPNGFRFRHPYGEREMSPVVDGVAVTSPSKDEIVAKSSPTVVTLRLK